jgi:hypothetical protein
MRRLTFLRGSELVNVAGESHYQEALRELTGTDGSEQVRREAEAVLVPEPGNPHDPNAVRVEIDGRLVGYLPRGAAVAYGPMLQAVIARGRAAACEAMIAGRGGEGPANLGVFLKLPEPTDPIPAAPPTRGAF